MRIPRGGPSKIYVYINPRTPRHGWNFTYLIFGAVLRGAYIITLFSAGPLHPKLAKCS